MLSSRKEVRGYTIDADYLMAKVAEEYGERARDALYRIIRYMPSAQPEIIYCKGCKYYNEHTEECDNDKGLRFLDYSNLDKMYCAWAERREDD